MLVFLKGFIAAVKEGFGFITCADREARMFFHFSEMMYPDKEIKLGDEVEFTIIQVRSNTTCLRQPLYQFRLPMIYKIYLLSI